MSSVDTAWLRMEEVTNQMTITAVLTFSAPLTRADVRRVVKERFLRHDRFWQRVRGGKGFRNPRWERDPHFDLDHHVQAATLAAPGTKAQLQELASELMSRPLDFSRPLWRFHVVEGYEKGAAVVVRLHHCIADGVMLMRVLLSLMDTTAGASPEGAAGDQAANALGGASSPKEPPAEDEGLGRRAVSAVKTAARQGRRAATLAARGLGVLGKLAWPVRDPETSLRGSLGRRKKAAWSEPVALADIKAVGQALGGTVNDVLLTAMTGAVRRYLRERGEPTQGLEVRAAVPVNLRPLDAPLEMGNAFGLVFLSLPVGVADPSERLRVLRRRMDRLKDSPEAPIVLKVLQAIGATTRSIENLVVTYLARKVTAVATNVPGPRQKLYLAGAPMETLMAWVPQAGRVGLGISIISYDGDVRLGLATDANLVPDPGAIIEHFYQEFDTLLQRVPGRFPPAAPAASATGNETERREAGETEAPAASSAVPAPNPDLNPERCQATTKAGTQCKLPAQDGARFCHVHR